MSYTVFALKWRPKNFDEIIGQGHIVTTLKSALEKNRLAHAYLFSGPRGVGKTSTARILAKALNCKSGPTVNPCQKCSSCIEISESRSFDVIEIDGASNTGVDDIRALRENVKFSPTSGKFKVYIIDEVHMLSIAAFNALLKTLEEPPEFVKFIFATTHPDKIPATVLSRCQRLDFRRITVMEIIAQLEKIVKQEKISIDKEVLFAIAKSSDGALRDAESILDQLVSFSKDKVSLKDVISVLGLVEQDILFEMTDKIIAKDPAGALTLLNSVIDQGKDVGVFLMNLIEHFRNLMIAKVSHSDQSLIDLPQDICDRLFEQSKKLALEDIFIAFNIMVNTQEMSRRLESLRIPLEVSLVKLAHDKHKHAHAATAQEPKKAPHPAVQEKKSGGEDVPREEPRSKEEPRSQDPADPPVSLEEISGIWQKTIDSLSGVKISVATYLSEGSPLEVKKNILTVSFPKNYSLHKESLEKKENRSLIEKELSGLLNKNIRVHFVLSEEKKTTNDTRENPLIKSALNTFNGRVIKEEDNGDLY